MLLAGLWYYDIALPLELSDTFSFLVEVFVSHVISVKIKIMPSAILHDAFLLSESGVPNQINRVISHPTLPVTITGNEDRHIRFFDNNTGK